jgi:predicted Zn-dependent protease
MKSFQIMKSFNVLAILSCFAAILMLLSCAINPVTGKKQIMFMSEAQELQLGSQYDPQVMATFGQYTNEPLQALIDQRGQEMGKISHRPNIEYHFRILDSPVINAFAVPGGYIYLTRGILVQFNNEAEMLGVLGHEMGHITARHSASQQTKQTLGQLLFVGGMIASEEFRKYGEYAMQGMQLLFLSFSRENEREADQLGVEYASKIGYDAQKMADFYKVLIKMNLASKQAGIPTFMSTHPDPGDRYNAVMRDAAKWQDSLDISPWKVNADDYLHLIDGMVYGEDPRQGYVEGQMFYHPEMKFQFPVPVAWMLDNSPMQVRMYTPDGKAIIIFTLAPKGTLEEAANATLQQLEVKLLESKRTTVNGMPAVSAISYQASQNPSTGQQDTIMVMSYFIDDNGTNYAFHGVTAQAHFNTYARIFEPTMGSFDKLTDPSKLNRQPKKISIKKVQSTGTLASTLRSFGVQQQKELEDLAFLNNMELTDQVAAGTLIKTVGD